MKYVLTILLVILIVENAKSCDCPKVKRDSLVYSGLRNSKIVFLGELLSSDEINGTFKFKILELFKGQSKKDIIHGKISNNCSLFPITRGLWLVYADYYQDSTIGLSICAESIPLNKAEGEYAPPPPLPPYNLKSDYDKTIYSLKDEINNLKQRTEGLSHCCVQPKKGIIRLFPLIETKRPTPLKQKFVSPSRMPPLRCQTLAFYLPSN